ncbi:MAG: HAMP domain-containing histidine kinase [Methylococcaceae bacterium]|nr:HAMP domain-containing histidine kinase [Methylococcaceae bacterium]
MKAAVYSNHQDLLAASGQALGCHAEYRAFDRSYSVETRGNWCFYAPIYQDSPSGTFERKLADTRNPDYLGHVELVVSKAEMESLLGQILAVSGLIVVFIVGIIFFLVRHFSGSFTQPLVEMVRVLNHVAQGIPGGRVLFFGASDMVALGETFNGMLSRIEMNERLLEQKIAERTEALKVALESSEAANHYKMHIVATVSHEMKAPLHTIRNCMEASLEALPDNSDNEVLRQLHLRALVRSDELNDMIGNILIHGKLEANSVKMTLLPVDLLPFMQVCAEKIAPCLERNRNTLQLLGKDDTVVLDQLMLSHIINNLLANACKFTVDGSITLNWWQDILGLVIVVSDTGCGIPEAYLGKIFDSFWQVDMSMTRQYGGTGIGLTVIKQFVDQLGGAISVTSQVGKGSVFTIKIPYQPG